jgi:spore photoproduct lyase
MAYQPYQPSKVYVEKRIVNHPVTKRILLKLSHLSPIIFNNLAELVRSDCSLELQHNAIEKPLVLAHQKGDFLKRCPGTQNYICCGYQILNLVNNCEINCSYCILQGYLNSPYIIVYVNIEDLFEELTGKLNKQSHKIFRIGTGELADSLSTDHLTGYSSRFVSFFVDKKNAIIELKTKSTQIENFINLEHNGRTVVAWSLNTPKIISTEESSAPTLELRLAAAERIQQAGFKLAFHFDPMIYYDNWEQDYQFVVNKIIEKIKPENITWISLGALRYPPHLDQIIRQNHPTSKIVYGELFPGKDAKLRYFKPIRIKMFSKMYQWIKRLAPDVFVYLCMESSEVWQKSFGWTPETSAELKRMMDKLVASN